MHVVRLAPCSAGWLLRTTMSSRHFPWFPLLVPKKFKAKGTKSKVSNLNCANFFEDQLRPGTSWEWSRDRLGNERVYLSGGPSFGDGGGEKIDSYLANSLIHIFIQELLENDLAIISGTMESTSEEERDTLEMNSKAAVRGSINILPYLTHIWIQILSDNPREVIPSTAQYIMATGKQTLKVLQSAAAFIPVPLIREAVGVALKIIEVCEEQCEVCKIPPRRCYKMVNNILLPGYIRCR